MFDPIEYKKVLLDLLDINSVSGLSGEIETYISEFIRELGVNPILMNKGGVYVDIGGESNDILYITAHCDTIGFIVKSINCDGTIKIMNIGGSKVTSVEDRNIIIHTRKGKNYTGVIYRIHSCPQIAPDGFYNEIASFDSNLCVVLDEHVSNKTEVEQLGINVGDIISLEPNCKFTDNGFIKSHYLDNKISVAILLLLAKDIIINNRKLYRHVVLGFTMYEEVGHGSAWIPQYTKSVLSVDAACTGPSSNTTERTVTIYAADARSPYHTSMINSLLHHAECTSCDAVIDILSPRGSTDCMSSIFSGNDVQFATIGPGIRGMHGYERTHIGSIENTYRLLSEYILES